MAHYRVDESYQNKFTPVGFSQQIIPGTFEVDENFRFKAMS